MAEDPPLDWYGSVLEEVQHDRLASMLHSFSCARWTEVGPLGLTLLHLACQGNNVPALVALVKHGLDVNVRSSVGWRPAHIAAIGQPRALELLCALGADVRAKDILGDAPLDFAIRHCSHACARVLVANGVRLSTVCREHHTSDLVAFERGVLRCRAAVAAMLRVKRAGRLWMWDKFLLVAMAIHVWATRYHEQWAD